MAKTRHGSLNKIVLLRSASSASSSHDYTRVIYLVDALFTSSYQAIDGS